MADKFNKLFGLQLSQLSKDLLNGYDEDYICFECLATLWNGEDFMHGYHAEIFVAEKDGRVGIMKKDTGAAEYNPCPLSKDEAIVFREEVNSILGGDGLIKKK